ncbi:MAG: FG-GAP repeat domain-containing protein, partial [Thermoanaerobaculia bacterium]
FGPFVAPGWQVAAVADFDGDGQADLFWRNGVTGDDAIWIMSGGEVFASATMPTVPNQAWQVATFGDYDGNGKTDLFWHNGLTGDNSIWLMNGVGPPVGAAMPPVYDTNWKPVRP